MVNPKPEREIVIHPGSQGTILDPFEHGKNMQNSHLDSGSKLNLQYYTKAEQKFCWGLLIVNRLQSTPSNTRIVFALWYLVDNSGFYIIHSSIQHESI